MYAILSWCVAYSCSNVYVKRKPGVAFSVSEAPDAASRVYVNLACNGPLVYNVDYGHFKSLDLAGESKTFRLRSPGLGIQVLGQGLTIKPVRLSPIFAFNHSCLPFNS